MVPALNPSAVRAHEPKQSPAQEYRPPKSKGKMPEPEQTQDKCEPIKLSITSLNAIFLRGNASETIHIDTTRNVAHKPHCLAGRATAVFDASVEGQQGNFVFKIYHPEVMRQNEGMTISKILDLADQHDQEMKKHLPDMVFCGDVPGCSTNRIRSMVGVDWRGHRTTRVLVTRKLHALTRLTGARFVKAWLECVKCTHVHCLAEMIC